MKRRFRRALARLLTLTGLSLGAAEDLLASLAESKSKLVLLSVASFLAPVCELGFIMLLYAMVSPDGQQEAVSRIDAAGLRPFYELVGGDAHYWGLIISAATLVLLLAVAFKIVDQLTLTYFKYDLDVRYMHRVIAAYLNAPPMTALRLDRNRVVAAALSEAVAYGVFAFNMLAAFSVGASVVLFLGGALVVSYQLLLVVAVLGFFTVAVARRAYARSREIAQFRIAVHTELVARLYDLIQGFRVVKVEAAERRLSVHMRDFLRTSQRWRIAKGHNETFVNLSSETLLYCALLLIVSLSLVVLRIETSLILVFLVLMSRLQKYLAAAQHHWLHLRANSVSLDAVQKVIAECSPSAALRSPASRPAPASREPLRIRLDGVSFQYPVQSVSAPEAIGDGYAVRDLDLELIPGDRVLIQGPSGKGKSTLVHLISGLLRPSLGRVLYNGQPLTEESFTRLRCDLAYAAPDLHVFRTSIRENLCIGRQHPEEAVNRAVHLARLDAVIAGLPGGLDSFIGENGSQLSLGERQRVMLARVFLKRPMLVLLDEATSNLDRALESAILDDLFRELDRDAVVVMVTHKRPVGVTFTREYLIEHGQLFERAREAADPVDVPRV